MRRCAIKLRTILMQLVVVQARPFDTVAVESRRGFCHSAWELDANGLLQTHQHTYRISLPSPNLSNDHPTNRPWKSIIEMTRN